MLCILKYKTSRGYNSARLFSARTMSKHNLGVRRQPTYSYFCVSLGELTFSHKQIKADSELERFLRTLLARRELVKFNLLRRETLFALFRPNLGWFSVWLKGWRGLTHLLH